MSRRLQGSLEIQVRIGRRDLEGSMMFCQGCEVSSNWKASEIVKIMTCC